MSKIRAYIHSFRLRTLPLSLSGIFLGILLAANHTITNFFTVILLINTTLCLQILANLANEYGDFVKGSDNNNRLGPIFSIQSGELSIRNILYAIGIFVLLSAVNGLALITYSIDNIFSPQSITFFIIGACAIVAAILYTVGKQAYGYKGLGDIFVFISFGYISTISAYILSGGIHISQTLLPASAIGLLSTAVLNLNNIRDIENDTISNKITIPVRIGIKKAKIYHFLLVILAFLLQYINHLIFALPHQIKWFAISTPLFIIHLCFVAKNNGKKLDKQMLLLSISTLLFAILCGI